MGRRRRRVIRIVKKKLPTVFTCPVCSEDAVKVTLPKGAGVAVVQCASCGAKDQFDVARGAQMVDVYCKFSDKYYATGRPQPATQVSSDQTS
jgi:transcription elongation factor Elf1